ncbi:MAG: hypothetical protein EA393_08150 [Bacteroidetes bacterium]|nr:MAG: hypothetical protein EA393_08150 [Bacteroidota bacterium]
MEKKSWCLQFLNRGEDHNETLIIKRKTGKGSEAISLDTYNVIMDTMHLFSSKSYADRLYKSIREINEDNTFVKESRKH